ncbi:MULTISPECIES: hypothetical protein [Sphingobacterium]|uniref:hypothetical protein n=1 Tax=Sphingobacterium TaxID=28453 RepID=UPI0013DB1A1A|nr:MULTISPECIES: hypothetical protein [unclassified Sphingobacterium]
MGYDADGKIGSETVSFQKVAGSKCFHATQFRKDEHTTMITYLEENETESDEIQKRISKAKRVAETSKSDCASLKLKFHDEEKRQNDQQKEQMQYLKNEKVDYQKKQDKQASF